VGVQTCTEACATCTHIAGSPLISAWTDASCLVIAVVYQRLSVTFTACGSVHSQKCMHNCAPTSRLARRTRDSHRLGGPEVSNKVSAKQMVGAYNALQHVVIVSNPSRSIDLTVVPPLRSSIHRAVHSKHIPVQMIQSITLLICYAWADGCQRLAPVLLILLAL